MFIFSFFGSGIDNIIAIFGTNWWLNSPQSNQGSVITAEHYLPQTTQPEVLQCTAAYNNSLTRTLYTSQIEITTLKPRNYIIDSKSRPIPVLGLASHIAMDKKYVPTCFESCLFSRLSKLNISGWMFFMLAHDWSADGSQWGVIADDLHMSVEVHLGKNSIH